MKKIDDMSYWLGYKRGVRDILKEVEKTAKRKEGKDERKPRKKRKKTE